MPQIRFVEPSGALRAVDARVGQTVLQVARVHGIAGLDAECGGNCSCATCHVLVENDRVMSIPAPTAEEGALIDCVLSPQANSRLACQLAVLDSMDGVRILVPDRQK